MHTNKKNNNTYVVNMNKYKMYFESLKEKNSQ